MVRGSVFLRGRAGKNNTSPAHPVDSIYPMLRKGGRFPDVLAGAAGGRPFIGKLVIEVED
jgi:hypothetical protein